MEADLALIPRTSRGHVWIRSVKFVSNHPRYGYYRGEEMSLARRTVEKGYDMKEHRHTSEALPRGKEDEGHRPPITYVEGTKPASIQN